MSLKVDRPEDYASLKAVGVVAVTKELNQEGAFIVVAAQKYNVNTGAEAGTETASYTVEELESKRASLQAKVAAIDALLVDAAKVPNPVPKSEVLDEG